MLYLVAEDFSFSVILEVAIALETTFHELAKLLCEGVVIEKVVDAKARARRLGRVSRTDASLGRADAGSAKLDLLQTIDDLVEVEDQLRPV